LRKMKLLIGLKNAGFLGWIIVPLKEKLKKSKLQSKCHKIRTDWQCQWQQLFEYYRCKQGSQNVPAIAGYFWLSAVNKFVKNKNRSWWNWNVTVFLNQCNLWPF
jgi:hypothetical protein